MSTQTTTASDSQTHNPARKWLNLRNFALVLVVFGLFVSGYLSYVKLANVSTLCPTGEGSPFNCDAVQNSIYSQFPIRSGIEVAWLGFGTYVLIGLLILFEKRIPILREWGIPLTFGIVLFAFLFSMYLVYVQAVLLRLYCMWCLMHELNMTVLFGVYIGRLVLFLKKPSVNEA